MRSNYSLVGTYSVGVIFVVLSCVISGSSAETEDPDFDDLTTEQENKLGTNHNKRDSDGDGLWDGWEFSKRMLDIPLRDADPLQKDLFVEIDIIDGAMSDAELQAFKDECKVVVESFKKHAVTLHLEWDQTLPAEDNITTHGGSNPQGRWGELRDANFAPRKMLTHRHVLIVGSYQNAQQNRAALYPEDGQSFTIKASSRPKEMAVLFMRGLGQTLGLAKGGLSTGYAGKVIRDESPEKPNHLSVMNDAFPLGVERKVDGQSQFELIYQEFDLQLPTDERKIIEREGIGRTGAPPAEMAGLVTFNRASSPAIKVAVGAAMDWNNNGNTTDELRAVDLNRLGDKSVINKHLPTLNEWTRIQLPAGAIGNFARYLKELSTPPSDVE